MVGRGTAQSCLLVGLDWADRRVLTDGEASGAKPEQSFRKNSGKCQWTEQLHIGRWNVAPRIRTFVIE